MGVPLPQDPFFNNLDNKWVRAGYDKVCREFGVYSKTDFRFTAGDNGGLGRIYKKMFGVAKDVTIAYDKTLAGLRTDKWPNGFFSFVDQPASFGNHELDHISPLQEKPYQFFMLNESKGLTKVGLSRLNQSIESFVYCILGAQVRTMSSIIGNSGSAQQTQGVFLQLFESSIIEFDISKSIERYQLATREARQKLNLAVAVGCWLLPSNLVINTTSSVGYNNMLIRVTPEMKFGINDVNNTTRSIPTSSTHPTMLPTKVNPPTQAKAPGERTQIRGSETDEAKQTTSNDASETGEAAAYQGSRIADSDETMSTHENNLTTITIIVSGLAWLIFR
jgi:hypothetical protein